MFALGHVGPVVASLAVAPQGFVNVVVAPDALFQHVVRPLAAGRGRAPYTPPLSAAPKKLKVWCGGAREWWVWWNTGCERRLALYLLRAALVLSVSFFYVVLARSIAR